ncbi:hypothetical protein Tco_0998279, partial [Tanacetum coccineum]
NATSESKSIPLPLSTLACAFFFDTDTPGVSRMTTPADFFLEGFLEETSSLVGVAAPVA